MLSTLIYRSRIRQPLRDEALDQLMLSARQRNGAMHVTGILLFDGRHFVQLLEGPDEAPRRLYESIRRDARHDNVVQLLHDHAPIRRFEGDQMAMLDLRNQGPEGVLSAILGKMPKGSHLAGSDDRVLKILQEYAKARWTDHIVEGDDAANWRLTDTGPAPAQRLIPGQAFQFALQPIVDPLRREITSFEFLVRSPSGGSPQQLFASLPAEQRYQADLQSKISAFRLANRLGIKDNVKLSVNLFPMSLISIPHAVDSLLEQIAASGLLPGQVIVEITEEEAISCLDAFRAAITRLRKAGIGVAIDDFGAGFAGLSLLAEFQPDKLKIDRGIIQGIHIDGPRQAIVRATLHACAAMGITPVAEGVESIEEWCWLQAAGIRRFQGYLFARPALNCIPGVQWPQRCAVA
ncbi:signaling protein [Bordetella ansorpii]|uniref:Signaling protein n=1 Tax=Bordetella ansorpii TaxID=288768 RepID=A0A157SGR1_9BORD|nr:diguanylate phosphodiesterase [Bordetella ansorpii]SAI69589.1 signaling protein [Bordetella ansorpii]